MLTVLECRQLLWAVAKLAAIADSGPEKSLRVTAEQLEFVCVLPITEEVLCGLRAQFAHLGCGFVFDGRDFLVLGELRTEVNYRLVREHGYFTGRFPRLPIVSSS
jgi:hypothetical protein